LKREYRVLVLEDTATDAELMERKLRKTGMKLALKQCKTEKEFRTELESFKPDLVLADYNLPQFDGLSALGIARQRGQDIPFIIVSGTLSDKFAAESLKRGATDYILKDRLERLGPAVERALQEADEKKLKQSLERRTTDLENENAAMREREMKIRKLKKELEELRDGLKGVAK
jgi:DNA-binding NtrC family response regulator